MDLTLHPPTTTPTLLPKSARSHSIWISTMDISMHQDQQEQTINHLHLGINEPDQALPTVDQDAPWRLTPWAHDVIIVDSLATSPTSVRRQSERKELALSVERKTIWLIRKKKLAAKKPGQKCPFGRSTHQENIGNDDSPAEGGNKGEAKEENTEDAEEDSHFGKRDE